MYERCNCAKLAILLRKACDLQRSELSQLFESTPHGDYPAQDVRMLKSTHALTKDVLDSFASPKNVDFQVLDERGVANAVEFQTTYEKPRINMALWTSTHVASTSRTKLFRTRIKYSQKTFAF